MSNSENQQSETVKKVPLVDFIYWILVGGSLLATLVFYILGLGLLWIYALMFMAILGFVGTILFDESYPAISELLKRRDVEDS